MPLSPSVRLGNAYISVKVSFDFGARVTSLVDHRSGREWINQGDLVGDPSENARYYGAPSHGWDECLPTVDVDAHPAWGGALRDHGALWARPWACHQTEDQICCTYVDPCFHFTRSITLAGPALRLDYHLASTAEVALPFLWSQHCLLACLPGDAIIAQGLTGWRTEAGAEVAVGLVPEATSGLACKSYARATGPARVTLRGLRGGLRFVWQADEIPFAGLWRNYGGWPETAPGYHLAIEPTFAATGSVSTADRQGSALWLPPKAERRWTLAMELC